LRRHAESRDLSLSALRQRGLKKMAITLHYGANSPARDARTTQ
jgi:hypothetical protein